MAETNGDTKVSYPYLSANQWYGVRTKMRQSMPKNIDIDWLISKLDTTQRNAQNILPQLRTLGLIDGDHRVAELADDLRHDETYGEACRKIVEKVYPESLRNAHSDSSEDVQKVASWFSRNARTGEVMSKNQAKMYLLLLGGKIPSGEEAVSVPRPRKRAAAAKPAAQEKTDPGSSTALLEPQESPVVDLVDPQRTQGAVGGPTIHIDLQIHISADAGDAQIDSIFESMAKHLYGR